MLKTGSRYVICVEHKLHQTRNSFFVSLEDVLIPYDVTGNLGVDPEIVELLPNDDILLDELLPQLSKLNEVFI
jgi:hypothetical protein